jgi:hypothetical protein
MNQETLCKAFCDQLRVREIPQGYAISTAFESFMGEDLSFYALRNTGSDSYRLFEDGTLIPHLEAIGASLENEARREAFTKMLTEHRAAFDDYRTEIFRNVGSREALEAACLDFMSLLMRVKDLSLSVHEKAENPFREEVRELLLSMLSGKAEIREQEPVSAKLSEISPDMVLRATNRDPVALFIATSAPKMHEALELHFMATYEQRIPLKVLAVIETDSSIPGRVRVRADNRLNGVLRFRSEEIPATERVAREVLGWQATTPPQMH